MMLRDRVKLLYFLIVFFAIGCIEPFEPRVNPNGLDMMVVDGFINATECTAVVRLSHAQPLSTGGRARTETNATVFIDASNGDFYPLEEQEEGLYAVSGMTLNKQVYYTLHVKTSAGLEYLSDTIPVRATPLIDSLNFSISSSGEFLNVLVSTHDPTRNTRYYAWDYIETYEYNSPDSSEYKFIKKEVIPRTEEESVYTCWRTLPGTKITIGTSARLTDDIIHSRTITQVPKGSIKLSVRYSVLVKQRAISPLEYTFLEDLQKTTEDIGGIFGSMPFAVVGNIHRVGDESEQVLGYFSGAEVTEKRLFVDFLDMPSNFRTLSTNAGCIFEETCLIFPEPLTNGPQSCLPLQELSDNVIILRTVQGNSYIWTSPECGDCRAKGGTTTRPDFW